LVVCAVVLMGMLAGLLFAAVTQIGLMTGVGGLGVRFDGVLFGATIAGPTVWLWPFLAGLLLYPFIAGRYWPRLLWVAAPVGLMFCGDGITALLHALPLGNLATQFGLGLALEMSGQTWFSAGGDLPATAGFLLGQAIFLKKAVFDPAAV
jgi:hypothetical protein